jgi:adenine phosphoribosyltransferase
MVNMSKPMDRAELRAAMRSAFVWQGDRTDDASLADMTGWWRDPLILASIGPALGDLFRAETPTVVLGVQSRGSLLGPLVANTLGVGFVEIRKNQSPSADSDSWLHVTTPPDYRDRNLKLGLRRRHLRSSDRAILVDDWIETGGQALGAQELVAKAGLTWLGLAVLVDGLSAPALRRRLTVRSLLHVRDL